MKSSLCAVVSDIHFPAHHGPAWGAFLRWCADWRPEQVIVNGDVVDFEALSRFAKRASTPHNVIDEIKIAARELNNLAHLAGVVTVVEGNHDERWSNIIGQFAQNLDGVIGLTLQEQFRFQGLDSRVRWVREDVQNKGVLLGPFRVRHGHKQAGPYGVKHIAAAMLGRVVSGTSQIVGHHHRAQLMAKSGEGHQIVAIANPHLSGDHEYATDPDWQRGFTVVECFGGEATAYPIVMTLDGRFAWGGRVYDGSATRAEIPPPPPVPDFGSLEPPDITSAADDADDFEDLDLEETKHVPSMRSYAKEIGVAPSTLSDWSKRKQRPWWEYPRKGEMPDV